MLTTADTSTSLAMLVPGNTLFRISELGSSWSVPMSSYAATDSLPWSMDTTLAVRATGNDVGSFADNLKTGAALSGVSPALGSETVVIDHTQPFEISWTPGDDSDAIMLLSIPIESATCYCDVSDSEGSMVLDTGVLSPASGEITLSRLTVSTVVTSNATIDLVGAVVQKAPVEVQ